MTQLTPDQARERLAHAMGYHGELTRRQVLIVSLVFAVLLCIVPLPLLLRRLEQVESDELKGLAVACEFRMRSYPQIIFLNQHDYAQIAIELGEEPKYVFREGDFGGRS